MRAVLFALFISVGFARAFPAGYAPSSPCHTTTSRLGATGPIFTETSTEAVSSTDVALPETTTDAVLPETTCEPHEITVTTTRTRRVTDILTETVTDFITETETDTVTVTQTESEVVTDCMWTTTDDEFTSRNQATFPPFTDTDLPVTVTETSLPVTTTTYDDCEEVTTTEASTRFQNPGPTFPDTTTDVATTTPVTGGYERYGKW